MTTMANAIRALAMDAVEQAKSGHPGLPMGMADVATVLFTQFLKFDPPIPPGPTATASCCPPATARCCSTRCSISPAIRAMTIERDQALPPARLDDRRPSGIRPHARRRDHHRPARPGPRQCGRHGARRTHAGRRIRRRSSITRPMCIASDGDLMEGISQEAIALAGHLQANQADRAVRRQRHFHRRRRLSLADIRRSGEALRSRRLDRLRVSTATTRRRSPPRSRRRRRRDRPMMIACKTTIGFGAPTKAGTDEGAWLAARRRRNQRRAREARLALPAVRNPGRHSRRWREAGRARRKPPHADWTSACRARCRQSAPSSSGACAAICRSRRLRSRALRSRTDARRDAERNRHPHSLRIRTREPDPGGAGNDRRLGRSHRLQQHAHQSDEGHHAGGLFRPLHPLRRARARHGGGHERHGAAWRLHSLWRHLPGLLRLLPAGDPARGADGHSRHSCDDARLHRARRRRADASAGRTSGGLARHSQSARVPPCDAVETAECWQLALEARHRPSDPGADAAKPAAARAEFHRRQPLRARRL